MKDTTSPTTTLDVLKGLRAKADASRLAACERAATATCLPKGKRGRKAAIDAACAEANAARAQLAELDEAIREAAAPAVQDWARDILRAIDDDVLVQIINAPKINITLRTEEGDVFASVSTNELGFPTYIEVRELAERDEVIATATKWRDTAKDDETRAAAEAILAAPEGFAMYAKASRVGSITVGVHHQWHDAEIQVTNYYLNASTSQAYTERDVDVSFRLLLVAAHLRSQLNALALPNDAAVRAKAKAVIA